MEPDEPASETDRPMLLSVNHKYAVIRIYDVMHGKDPSDMKHPKAVSLLLIGVIWPILTRCVMVEQSDGSEVRPQAGRPGAAPNRNPIKTVGSRLRRDEVQTLIRLHNKVRAGVGAGPIHWSAALAAYAQKWADHLAATGCSMEHRPSSGAWRRIYGENLFMGTAGYYGVGDAVESWADEKKDYHGGALSSSNWHDAGHYTQIVWRDSRELGCAKTVCNGMIIVVCNYNPPGNVMGEKPY
jgi:pathogenesis-related protein 1